MSNINSWFKNRELLLAILTAVCIPFVIYLFNLTYDSYLQGYRAATGVSWLNIDYRNTQTLIAYPIISFLIFLYVCFVAICLYYSTICKDKILQKLKQNNYLLNPHKRHFFGFLFFSNTFFAFPSVAWTTPFLFMWFSSYKIMMVFIELSIVLVLALLITMTNIRTFKKYQFSFSDNIPFGVANIFFLFLMAIGTGFMIGVGDWNSTARSIINETRSSFVYLDKYPNEKIYPIQCGNSGCLGFRVITTVVNDNKNKDIEPVIFKEEELYPYNQKH